MLELVWILKYKECDWKKFFLFYIEIFTKVEELTPHVCVCMCVWGILFKDDPFLKIQHARETGLSRRRTLDDSRLQVYMFPMSCHGMHRKIRINWRIGRNLRVAARVVRASCVSLRGDLVTCPSCYREEIASSVCILHLFDAMPIRLRDLWRSRNDRCRENWSDCRRPQKQKCLSGVSYKSSFMIIYYV